jgi:formylglycine-generating enzyme
MAHASDCLAWKLLDSLLGIVAAGLLGACGGEVATAHGASDGATGGAAGGPSGGAGTTSAAGAATSAGAASVGGCAPDGPSCDGVLECNGESCGTSILVPGGTYDRGGDPAQLATVSDYCLDRYEVTVGRYRRFLDAYDVWRSSGHPTPGEGARPAPHPLEATSGWDPGWDVNLPENASAIRNELGLHWSNEASSLGTWHDPAGTVDQENYPINYMGWYGAFLFCIWDGGWLPTEAEWEYAASGGDGRPYPWGSEEPMPLPVDYMSNHGTPCLPVGSEPSGNGRWGHADLAGSMLEWCLDTYGTYPVPCDDCASLLPDVDARAIRGGSWEDYFAFQFSVTRRGGSSPATMFAWTSSGIRCARSPREAR